MWTHNEASPAFQFHCFSFHPGYPRLHEPIKKTSGPVTVTWTSKLYHEPGRTLAT